MPAPRRTSESLAEALPGFLREKGLTLRGLARAAGVDHSHLSRVLHHQRGKTAGPDLARRVAEALELPHDFFPEYREASVIERVRRDEELRDELYERLMRE